MTGRLTCDQVRDRELVERYVAGTADELDAEALEAHALECADCWGEIQRALELHAALSVPSASVAADRSAMYRRRWFTWAAAAAAAVVVIGGGAYWSRPPQDEAPALRGTMQPFDVAAAWQVDGRLRVSWPPQPGADLYRVNVTSEGEHLATEEVAETSLLLSPSERLGGRALTVVVEAQRGNGEIVARSSSATVPAR
jgi:hypothetical protein